MNKILLSVCSFILLTAASAFAQDKQTATVFAPGVISKPGEKESDLIISPLKNELFYVIGEWPNTKIMHSEKTAQGWSLPDTASFSSNCYATEPTFSADGKWIYYASSKGKDNVLHYNLWRAQKTDSGWSEGESVLDLGADTLWEFHPTMTKNNELFFCLWNSNTQKGVITKVQCTEVGCVNPQEVDLSISADYGISDPYVNYESTYMIVSTNKPGGYGDFDHYITYRQADGSWGALQNLGKEFNTSGPDFDIDISPDGKYIIWYNADGILWQTNSITNKTALLVVDIQNDYFKGGAKELVGTDAAAANAQKVITHFREKGNPVIYIRHISEYPGASFFVPNSKGNEINQAVKPLANEKVIIKHYPNSFKETELLAYLHQNGITKLVIVGMMTHMCIDATTRAASDLGFSCTLIADACGTCNLTYQGEVVPAQSVHNAFLAALKGSYAQVVNAQDYIRIE